MPGFDVIHRQLYDSASFRSLPEDSRTLFVYLLANKHRTTFGYYVLPDTYTSEDLQWSPERVAAAWEDIPEDMAKRDKARRLVFMPNALRFNQPMNPNVVKHWGDTLAAMPPSPLLDDLGQAAELFLEKDWQRAFINGIGNPLPNPLVNPLAKGSPDPSERVRQIKTPTRTRTPTSTTDRSSTLGHPGGEAAPGGGDYQGWLRKIEESRNKAGTLTEMVKALTGETVNTARLGKMLRDNFNRDAIYMGKVLWTAASRPITGDFLNYVERMKPSPQKHQGGGPGKVGQASQGPPSGTGDGGPLPTGGVEEAGRLWREALKQLKGQVSRANYKTWLQGTTGEAFEGDVFVVGVPTIFCKEWLAQRLVPHIRNTLAGLGVDRPVLRFKVHEGGADPGGADGTG